MMKTTLLCLLCMVVFGCANQSVQHAHINFIPLMAKPTPAIHAEIAKKESVYLVLGVIPGAIYGSPLKNTNWFIDMNPQEKPKIDVNQFVESVALFSAEKIDHPYNENLSIKPKNTKFARISTFGWLSNPSIDLGGGLEDKDGKFIVLAYFDRACTLMGLHHFDGTPYHHKVVIEKPGLYNLIGNLSNGEYTITAEQSDESIFVVLK